MKGDCATCNGKGILQYEDGRYTGRCPDCHGTGQRKFKRLVCPECKGEGFSGGTCQTCGGNGLKPGS